jgi:DNA polymerase
MTPSDPRSLLEFQAAMGADEAIGDVAVDRLAPPAVERVVRVPSPRPVGGGKAPGHASRSDPTALAAASVSIPDLVAAIEAYDGCGLKRTATRTVVYDGSPEARLMLIGEAPGAEEDRQGKPFVGAAGRLLDRMLLAVGLDRAGVYITNTIFWRPPGNRTPTPEEVGQCLPFVERQIALVAPKVLVFLGASAAKALLGRSEGITRLRGRWLAYQGPGLPAPVDAIATFHPAYLLRQPSHKRESWRDLLAIRARLDA